jgi:FtsP/CotA-like multicopper oxidase with cupredoxin domain
MLFLTSLGVSSPDRTNLPHPVPVEPEVHGKLTLIARTAADGHSEFHSSAGDQPPVIRVWPGDTLDVTYENRLSPRSREECATGPCMNMTNIHFHGLTVSPKPGQDDVLGMMAKPGQTLHYSLRIPPEQPPGLFWYHTHPHGESMRQDLDGMSGAIVVEGIDR